jgi:fumarylacetoacetate (FAA) hydrolase
MFSPRDQDLERGWPGRIDGDKVIQLAAQTLQAFFTGGGTAREHAEYPLGEVAFRAPVLHPPSVRIFDEAGDFVFANPAAVKAAEEEPGVPGAEQVERVAAIIGADGEIGGFTVMNDWSARDLQRKEMKVGLGPAKGKDFATSLGPVLVTPDELGDLRLEMAARVNGEERSRGNLGDMYHSWEAIVAQAARNTELRPGDVLGSGTVGTGCILEHGDERWLQPGDEVELEVEGIGVLRNRIGTIGA